MPKAENKKTRPDLKDDQEWLVWTAMQPENKGLDVHGMYRSMLAWCQKKGITPTRRRLLRWLDNERDDIPMTSHAQNATPPKKKPSGDHEENNYVHFHTITDNVTPRDHARIGRVVSGNVSSDRQTTRPRP